jgi:uncharacterized protein with HEPN domain
LPFRDVVTLFGDILSIIENIEEFVAGMTLASYQADLKTKFAVERALQVITEAAKILGPRAEELCPGIDWKGFRGMGDILRHTYHRVDDQTIWNVIQDELPPMRDGVAKALESGGQD